METTTLENEQSTHLISTLIDNPIVERVLKNFIDGLPERMKNLSQALASNDWDTAKNVAHSLRGTAGNFGYPTISEIAGRIEDGLKQKQEPRTEDINELQRDAKRAIDGYAYHLAKMKP